MIPSKCNVVRDGLLKNSAAGDLVVGDVVFVRLGDKVPADIFVFHASDFKVDNSSLTGEAEPQERVAHNTYQNPLEATNLAFNGTLCVSGECYGVVIRTGDQTVLGQIANMTQGEAKRRSPLSAEIERFVHILSAIAIVTAIVFFIVAQVIYGKISVSLNFAIGVLVAYVPQGLPATVTMLLTIAAKRMASKQVLVKDLQGVETLGAITLLATDKTGTLTRNQMTVTNLWVSNTLLAASTDSRQLSHDEKPYDPKMSGVEEVLQISSLCSRYYPPDLSENAHYLIEPALIVLMFQLINASSLVMPPNLVFCALPVKRLLKSINSANCTQKFSKFHSTRTQSGT